ncbi:MAG: extracellular solute-binding protein, partial [Verrucomicrobiota bacterium]
MKLKFAAAPGWFRLLRLTAAVGCCALANGRAHAAEVTLDIPVFAGGYGTAFYEETARQFEAMRSGVKVSLYGDPRVADKVRVRVIDGHLPDAVLSSNLLWPVLIRAGKVRDLTAVLAGPNWEGDARWGDTFVPGATEAWRVDGGIYGLPFAYACWTIFYDKAVFRAHGWEVPRTWDEFFALCEKIRAAGLAPLSLPGTRWLYADAFLRAASHNLLGDAAWRALGEPAAVGARLDPGYVRAAEVLQRITQRETAKGWEGESHTGAQQAFLAGRAAMTVSGSWFVNEMRGKLPPGFELGAMNFPVFSDGAADASTIQTGSDCFFVFATGDAERERLTVDFLRFLTSRARAEAFVRSADAPVAVRGVPAAAYSPLMQDTVALIAQAGAAFNVPQEMLQPPALRQALVDASQLLTTGKITPREFSERLEAAAAADRVRATEPDHVDVKHGWAAACLLLGLSAVAGWLGWSRVRIYFCTRDRRPRAVHTEAAGAGQG